MNKAINNTRRRGLTVMKLLGAAVITLHSALFVSCSDMIDVDEPRNIDGTKSIAQKTDSLFYAWGIMQAMQQAADAYVLQNEMRGDLVTPTSSANTHLRQLADFSATTACKYDSAYVYYKVVNNCNNFLAHRDTTLMDGSYNLTLDEYAAVHAFRAWAYLQLARTYGRVKFFTHPLLTISQIDGDQSPELDIKEIVAQLAPELERFADHSVPNYADINCGRTNLGITKTAYSKFLYIPVHVILGELYLESGEYLKAARHYYDYLYANRVQATNYRCAFRLANDEVVPPADLGVYIANSTWTNSWSFLSNGRYRDLSNNPVTIISYIPMAVNRLMGKTTELPELFGYDYYATSASDRNVEAQIVSSDAYTLLADSADYYYTSSVDELGRTRRSAKLGDMRRWARTGEVKVADSTRVYPTLYQAGNVILYRSTTVWLHLAEALNRAGYPDAAFAILKDGITPDLQADTTYISSPTKELFTSTLPFFGNGAEVFTSTSSQRNYGIHGYGCSDLNGIAGVYSPYQLDTIVGLKLRELEQVFAVQPAATKADTINAVEDLLCDEYAMEFAFEGCRFSDLQRLARHKNESGLYGGNFGGRWLARKLEANKPTKDLTIEANWYLPFK